MVIYLNRKIVQLISMVAVRSLPRHISCLEPCLRHIPSLHTSQNGYHKQINKQQVLARLWRKGNLSTLLVGVQTVAATVENSMEFPQKTKNGIAF